MKYPNYYLTVQRNDEYKRIDKKNCNTLFYVQCDAINISKRNGGRGVVIMQQEKKNATAEPYEFFYNGKQVVGL